MFEGHSLDNMLQNFDYSDKNKEMTYLLQQIMKKNNIYIYALEGKVVFPYHEYSFTINSNNYNPQTYDNLIGFVTKIDDLKQTKSIDKIEGLSRYGTLLKIHKSDVVGGYKISDKTKIFTVNYIGLTFSRFKILSVNKLEGKILANIQIYTDDITKQIQQVLEKKKLLVNLKKQLKLYYECKLRHFESQNKKAALDLQASTNKIIFKCIDQLQLPYIDKLAFLQLSKHESRIQYLLQYLVQKTQNIKSVMMIEEKVRQQMHKATSTKKMITIGSRNNNEHSELQQKINNKKMPDHVKEQIQKQMKRMGGETQTAVVMKYIQTLLQIPWYESSEEVKDINVAQKILNNDHTGLKDVKERILEFLAVKFRNGNSKGNIICLHGPPGVGKTSIAKSVAKSLGREFTRISLGGMNDQAELRGHRRTYVAALPGVIIRALIKAKTNNPVILLDQIQKIGKSYKGDPEHALLQILDPSQNSSFVDHYVSIPVDLSKVMFICTANSLQLSTPLLNRLELIEVPGYTRQQKFEIARNHLIPLQIKQNGVESLIQFEGQGLKQIIKYSSEMGVRELERKISKICRKIARKGQKQVITKAKVEQILGKRNKNEFWKGIGVVNGMAWTQMGGKLLTVEAIQFKSNRQKIEVTGQLGDVMKESVNIAFSWIKANIQDLPIVGQLNQSLSTQQKIDYLEKMSLHIHFPQGATKKDGPSAGVTIVTCIVSLLLKTAVRENLSMTGQITLSGKVLPVGGIKQKCIAAIYEGIKHIIVPHANMKDVEKISPQLRNQAEFYYVKDLKQVLNCAFLNGIDRIVPKL